MAKMDNKLKEMFAINDPTFHLLQHIIDTPSKKLAGTLGATIPTSVKKLYDKAVSPRDFMIPLKMLLSNDSSREQYVYSNGLNTFAANLVTDIEWEKVMQVFRHTYPRPAEPPTLFYRVFELGTTWKHKLTLAYIHKIFLSSNIEEGMGSTRVGDLVYETTLPFEGENTNIDTFVKYAITFEDRVAAQNKKSSTHTPHLFEINFGNRSYSTENTKAIFEYENTTGLTPRPVYRG